MDPQTTDPLDPDEGASLDDKEMWALTHTAGSRHGEQSADGGVLVNVHPERLCEGRPCCIHHPSDHALKDAPLNWRGDRRIMERICEHGVGHPDPDDGAYRASQGDEDMTHACDGCCVRG